VEDWVTLKEAGDLLNLSAAAIRYRAFKKGMYEHRREQREYGETVVVSTQSLVEKHPELKEKLGDDLKLPAKEDASIPSYKTQGGRTVPAPEGGPRFVTEFVTEKPSLEVREEEGDIDRIRSLLDELEEIEKQAQEIKRREQEIKKALKTLIMERY
jgi:hypothetical protein